MMKEPSNVDVKRLRKQIRKKATDGTVTTGDWRQLAASDPEVARKELSGYLKSYDLVTDVNPFRNTTKSPGVGIGFLIGLALTIIVWYLMPDLRAALKDDVPGFATFATGMMFAATFFSVIGAWLGGRRGRPATSSPADGSFEELLRRFEALQRTLHRA
jgi:hypothetical protein